MYAKRIDSIAIRRLKEMHVALCELLEEIDDEELTARTKALRSELKWMRRTMWGVLKDLDEQKELKLFKP